MTLILAFQIFVPVVAFILAALIQRSLKARVRFVCP